MSSDRRPYVGQRGESIARAYLLARGFTILHIRWHPAPPLRGDIDLVAWRGGEIVFVEVRTRSTYSDVSRNSRQEGFDRAYGSIGPRKQAQLVTLAHAYITEHDLTDVVWRIDGIAIAYDPITGRTAVDHTENLLDW